MVGAAHPAANRRSPAETQALTRLSRFRRGRNSNPLTPALSHPKRTGEGGISDRGWHRLLVNRCAVGRRGEGREEDGLRRAPFGSEPQGGRQSSRGRSRTGRGASGDSGERRALARWCFVCCVLLRRSKIGNRRRIEAPPSFTPGARRVTSGECRVARGEGRRNDRRFHKDILCYLLNNDILKMRW